VRATLLLCEAAQVADGKLNVLGAGWIEIGTGPATMAVAVLIQLSGPRRTALTISNSS